MLSPHTKEQLKDASNFIIDILNWVGEDVLATKKLYSLCHGQMKDVYRNDVKIIIDEINSLNTEVKNWYKANKDPEDFLVFFKFIKRLVRRCCEEQSKLNIEIMPYNI